MEKIQETVNIVEKLTTDYYAALGLIFAIFLGVIVFLIYDKNSLKKEMRDKYQEMLELEVEKLQIEFDKGMSLIERKNNLKLFMLENQVYFFYLKDSLRNVSTRSKKKLIWSIIYKSFIMDYEYLKQLKNSDYVTEEFKKKEAERLYKKEKYILKECKKDNYFLFKNIGPDPLKYLKDINKKIEEINEIITLLKNSDKNLNVPTINIDEMIEKQKRVKDSREILKRITREGTIHKMNK